jgi:chemotaxis protein histidine kinase CheA
MMAELVALDRVIVVLECGASDADVLGTVAARLRTVAQSGAATGQRSVEELAREAERLIVAYMRQPSACGADEADLVRHVVDVLSLLTLAARRSHDARPAASLDGAVQAARDRMRYAWRVMGGS